jgi:uncharacterized protein with NAD-binding domain and iron-sulfur cluster
MFPRWLSGALGANLLALSIALPGSAAPLTDVLVVGGTPAGVAAAVAAARRGENVVLVARRSVLGGVLTDAMMDQWDLNMDADGRSVEGGIFREIYAALGDSFSPADAARVFGELVASEPRIRVVTDALPLGVVDATDGSDRRVATVTFSDLRAHRVIAFSAPYVIDATDDGDVAALAGARYDLGRQDTGRDTLMQPVTLMFSLTGVDWAAVERGYHKRSDGPGGAIDRRAWGYAKLMTRYVPLSPDVVVRDLNFGHEDSGSVTVNAIDVLGIDGAQPSERDRARAIAQAETPHLIAFLRANVPGFADATLGRYADALYVRETRHFIGIERLTSVDVWDGKIPADAIGLSSYPLDLHPVTANDRPAFAPVRHVYGVPFGTLIPRGFSNLILAGPAISASHIASGSARVIPTTIEEGEAAGAAASQALAHHLSFEQMASSLPEIAQLRDDLRDHGVLFGASPPQDVALRR